MIAIKIDNVTKSYDMGKTSVQALRGINLKIEQGDFVSIAGSSGSGKSTLLNLIGCLDVPTTGEIYICDTPISNFNEKQMNNHRLRTLGFVFQSYNLIPVLNIYENVEMPLLIRKDVSKEERRDRVTHFIEAVGLKDMMKRKPAELSGGQRQRVAVARALVGKPKIVLADEPTANLDSKTGIEIIDLMHEIQTKENTTFIFSTHDPKVMKRTEHIVYLEDGLVKSEERK